LPTVSSREKIDWRKFLKSSQDLWNYNKRSKIYVIGVLEGEEKEGRAGKILEEIMLEISQIWQKV